MAKKKRKYSKEYLEHQFKPGQSGNPNGRPKGMTLTECYRHLLSERCPRDRKRRTWGEVIAEAVMKKARKGQIDAAREITNRLEGTPRQTIVMPGLEMEPPTINVQFVAVRESTEIGSVQTQFKQLEAQHEDEPR